MQNNYKNNQPRTLGDADEALSMIKKSMPVSTTRQSRGLSGLLKKLRQKVSSSWLWSLPWLLSEEMSSWSADFFLRIPYDCLRISATLTLCMQFADTPIALLNNRLGLSVCNPSSSLHSDWSFALRSRNCLETISFIRCTIWLAAFYRLSNGSDRFATFGFCTLACATECSSCSILVVAIAAWSIFQPYPHGMFGALQVWSTQNWSFSNVLYRETPL
jgi:hypothetical protein